MIISDKNIRYWLFLKKTYEIRSYKGTNEYEYIVGKKYTYDSYVQNSNNVQIGDFVIFREDDYILGYAIIDRIDKSKGIKEMRRCPKCKSSSLMQRKIKKPEWRCANPRNKECKFEFDSPFLTKDEVIVSDSYFKNYIEFDKVITVEQVKRCSATKFSTRVQNALMELDFIKIKKLINNEK